MQKEKSTKLRSEWEERLEKFKNSGLSQTVWCKEKNINLKTFSYWYHKLNREGVSKQKSLKNVSPESKFIQSIPCSFVPVEIKNIIESPKRSIINIKIGNAIIETDKEFDSEHLLKIVKTLNAIC